MPKQPVAQLTRALTNWYAGTHRPLPWRESTDPYLIWISEVMLQQTQVATVLPYFERFTARFPTVQALAEAPLPDVLRLWAGLGYYSRARNLHAGALHICVHHGGLFPKTRQGVLSVPGIGPYTAGAILSIAFNLPEPVVDGNVQRVMARFYKWNKVLESTPSRDFFWAKAREWVESHPQPRILNQALMELGALVCTKHSPRCGVCPLKANCKAFLMGRPERYPIRQPRKPFVELRWVALVFDHRGKLFLRKRTAQEWWTGLWDFPTQERRGEIDMSAELGGEIRHTVTHHRIRLTPVRMRLAKRPDTARWGPGRWLSRRDIAKLPTSSLVQKILRNLE